MRNHGLDLDHGHELLQRSSVCVVCYNNSTHHQSRLIIVVNIFEVKKNDEIYYRISILQINECICGFFAVISNYCNSWIGDILKANNRFRLPCNLVFLSHFRKVIFLSLDELLRDHNYIGNPLGCDKRLQNTSSLIIIIMRARFFCSANQLEFNRQTANSMQIS